MAKMDGTVTSRTWVLLIGGAVLLASFLILLMVSTPTRWSLLAGVGLSVVILLSGAKRYATEKSLSP